MSYFHFTTFKCGQLESLYRLGYFTRKVGSILKRHHSSISQELKRSSKENKIYDSEQAQKNISSEKYGIIKQLSSQTERHNLWNSLLNRLIYCISNSYC